MEFSAKLYVLWFSIVLSSHLCLSRQHCPLICISLMATLHIRFQHRSQLRIYRSGWKPLDCCGPVQAFVEVTNVCNSKCSVDSHGFTHTVSSPTTFLLIHLDSSIFLMKCLSETEAVYQKNISCTELAQQVLTLLRLQLEVQSCSDISCHFKSVIQNLHM